MRVMRLVIVCGIMVLRGTSRTSHSARLMSARSKEGFWGRGRHQEWRATSFSIGKRPTKGKLPGPMMTVKSECHRAGGTLAAILEFLNHFFFVSRKCGDEAKVNSNTSSPVTVLMS
jgi:hypothetical protein